MEGSLEPVMEAWGRLSWGEGGSDGESSGHGQGVGPEPVAGGWEVPWEPSWRQSVETAALRILVSSWGSSSRS